MMGVCGRSGQMDKATRRRGRGRAICDAVWSGRMWCGGMNGMVWDGMVDVLRVAVVSVLVLARPRYLSLDERIWEQSSVSLSRLKAGGTGNSYRNKHEAEEKKISAAVRRDKAAEGNNVMELLFFSLLPSRLFPYFFSHPKPAPSSNYNT